MNKDTNAFKIIIHVNITEHSEPSAQRPTWVAWRSSALSLSAPSQTLCNAPPGRGLTACACRCDRTGPKRGTVQRNTCFHTCTCSLTTHFSTKQSKGFWIIEHFSLFCTPALKWNNNYDVKVEGSYTSVGLAAIFMHSPNLRQCNRTLNIQHNETDEFFKVKHFWTGKVSPMTSV